MNSSTIMVVLGVVAVGGLVFYLASQRQGSDGPANFQSTSTVDQGSAERTAWVNLFGEGLRTTTEVVRTVRESEAERRANAARQASGSSTPSSTGTQSVRAG